MKRFLTLLMSGAAALFMVGCMNDIDEGLFDDSASGALAIDIDGSIAQVYTTRVDDGGFCGGDQVGLYGVNYTDSNATAGTLLDSGNQVDNALYTYNEESHTWNARGNIYYKDANTNIDLYAYYPFGTPESVSAYPFEVLADQSGAGVVDGHSMSDFLWGKTEGVVPSSQRVKIKFQHRMAATQVVLEMGENWSSESEWESAKIKVLQTGVTRNATIDLTTGHVSATGEVSAEATLMRSTAEGWRGITVPQTVEGLTPLFAIDIDGVTYRYKRADAFTFESGKMHRFTITVNKKPATGSYELVLSDCQIVDWVADLESHGGEARQYYVVHLGEGEAGMLGSKIMAADKNPDKIKNLKVSGEICASDFFFMRDHMEILQAVNLREAKIVATTWEYSVSIDGGAYHYECFAGEYPATYEECRAAVQARYPNSEITYNGTAYNSYRPADEIPYEAFHEKQSLAYFVFPEKVTKIGNLAFRNTMLSGALIIPDDVVEICVSAFESTYITSLQLPYNLKSLGSWVFGDCKVLGGNLVLPESLESIGSYCFHNCTSLTGELVLPHGLKVIEHSTFFQCNNLSGDLVIPEGVETIEADAFYSCSNLTGQLSLPTSLKGKIGAHAFFGCGFQGELVIPEGVTQIGESVFLSNDFSSIVLPEGLLHIGEQAFYDNWRLCEPVVFPSTLKTIGKGAFYGCCGIPAIDLPAELTMIGESAFFDCYGISSIVSRAKTPPTVFSNAFYGVAKDNFTLEVPEASVVKYQTATGWSDFMRIAAHHDFSINRRLMRTLNAGDTKSELILRAPAGKNWKVESMPEWVTLNRTAGTGKVDDIVLTVSPMDDSEVGTFEVAYLDGSTTRYTTHAGRKGEIVFLLEDEGYRSTMVVEQYDYEYADGEVIVCQEATEGHGVDLVFLGDCFDAKDISEGKYLDGVNEAIEHFFAIEPYKTYRNYFNVYTVLGVSPDSGVGTLNNIKEAKFGTQYTLNAGLVVDAGLDNIFDYTEKAIGSKGQIKNTLITMVLNTNQYGGLTFMWGDGTAIALCPMSDDAYPYDFRGLVQHEAGGHGFAKLADEYIYHSTFITNCACKCCNHIDAFRMGKNYGWYRNLAESGNMDIVPWSHLIFHDKYANIVDVYEGGYFHARGIYRSEPTSCMNNNIPYFSAISRQTIVERIMKLANEKFSLADFYAKDVLDASNNTRADLHVEDNVVTRSAAAKQMPPMFMGEAPEL